MTVAEELGRAVRRQLGLGRLLPLGTGEDSGWVAEESAVRVLRAGAARVPGVRLDRLRIAPADPAAAWPEPAPVRPPSALPPGPLLIEGEFAAAADGPLPERAALLRTALDRTAGARLGFAVAGIDLVVTGLLAEGAGVPERSPAPEPEPEAEPGAAGAPGGPAGLDRLAGTAAEVARAVLAVEGVSRLAPVLGGSARAVRLDGAPAPGGGAGESGAAEEGAEPGVLVQLAVAGEHQAREVVRRARAEAAIAAGTERVAVVVTAID